ncbi:MAG TPA: FkbM family methyltransferase [Acidimicrobiales bacterium]
MRSPGSASSTPFVSRLEWAKHLLIGSPLERPVRQLRRLPNVYRRLRAPELNDVWSEPVLVQRVLRRVVKVDSNAVDVGAHLGSFTSTIVRLAPRGRHVAIEALPHKAAWLRQKFPTVDVIEVAVTHTTGIVRFHHNVRRSGFSGIRKHAQPGDHTVELEVRAARLDDVVPDDRRVDLLKLDVEGEELLVLHGASGLLDRCRPSVLFECAAETTSEPERRALHDLFSARDYGIWTASDLLHGAGALTVAEFEHAVHYPFRALNFFALPQEAVSAL